MDRESMSTATEFQSDQGDSKDVWEELRQPLIRFGLTQVIDESHYEQFKKNLACQETHLNDRMLSIISDIETLRSTLTRYGLTELHREAEQLISEGKDSLSLIESTSAIVKIRINDVCKRLNCYALNTMKSISESNAYIRFKRLADFAEQHMKELEANVKNYNKHLSIILSQFHWKNLAFCAVLTLIMGFLMILYIDDLWPWEMRDQIIKERNDGQALLNAWPQLSQLDQQIIVSGGVV